MDCRWTGSDFGSCSAGLPLVFLKRSSDIPRQICQGITTELMLVNTRAVQPSTEATWWDLVEFQILEKNLCIFFQSYFQLDNGSFYPGAPPPPTSGALPPTPSGAPPPIPSGAPPPYPLWGAAPYPLWGAPPTPSGAPPLPPLGRRSGPRWGLGSAWTPAYGATTSSNRKKDAPGSNPWHNLILLLILEKSSGADLSQA